MGVVEIPDFRKRGGDPERVTVVTPDEIDDFLGARNRPERVEHLQALRSRGLLITHRGRTLQQYVKGFPQRCVYVFRGPAAKVPRIGKGRLPAGVIRW